MKGVFPKLVYGLVTIVVLALFFGLMLGTVALVMLTHGTTKIIVIVVVILILALMIGNDKLK